MSLDPCNAPRASAEHLIWRLASVRPDEVEGWFLFDGAQINTMVAALKNQSQRKNDK